MRFQAWLSGSEELEIMKAIIRENTATDIPTILYYVVRKEGSRYILECRTAKLLAVMLSRDLGL